MRQDLTFEKDMVKLILSNFVISERCAGCDTGMASPHVLWPGIEFDVL